MGNFSLASDAIGNSRLEEMSPVRVCERGLRAEPQEYTQASRRLARPKAWLEESEPLEFRRRLSELIECKEKSQGQCWLRVLGTASQYSEKSWDVGGGQ